ncbi:hypothetical protein ACHAXT_002970 [Thalassiosira profunda]
MSDDDSASQGEAGGGFDAGPALAEAAADGSAAGAGGASLQMLPPPAARKRAKTSTSGSRRSKAAGGSSSRTRPVVKLLVTSVSRSYSEPWRRRQQRESSGTGFLIGWKGGEGASPVDGIRIVTNAHVVRNASTVRARASFGPHVVSCEVEWESLPLDLALLKIAEGDWEDFCKGWSFNELSAHLAAGKEGTEEGEGGKGKESAASDMAVAGSEAHDAGKQKGEAPSSGGNGSSKTLTLSTGLPKLDENVTCVGFPQGGTQISVTRGVVSRIDVDSNYVLRIQIDAAINPGNSGGPVFDEHGAVVGIASSHLRAASNIGYIIPSKIVAMFLQMCMDGMEVGVEDRFSGLGELVVREGDYHDEKAPRHVPGVPNLAIHGSQSLESKALRRHLGLEDLDLSGGIRIVGAVGCTIGGKAPEDAPTVGEGDDGKKEDAKDGKDNTASDDSKKDEKHLRGDDVLLAIDGCCIGYDGTIQLSPTRPDERINFRSLVTCQRVGSRVTLDVLRDKKRKELDVELDMSRFLVSQYDDFDAVPLYVVVGGCVFSPLSLPLIQEKKSKSPSSFSRFYRDQRTGHEQVLVLSKVLNDDVNVGYHGWKNLVLKSVNGHEPTNIQELVAVLVRKMHSEMIEFRCQVVGQEDADYVIVMNLNEVLQSEQRVMKQHMIASWCSKDALSRNLREEMVKCEPSKAKRTVSYNTMKDMRAVLERKEES